MVPPVIDKLLTRPVVGPESLRLDEQAEVDGYQGRR